MSKAIRQFTDRTEPQAAFRNAYLDMANRMPGENHSRIITYYGMGGIGKSRLLEQLKENLSTEPAMTAKNKRKPLVVYFDFEESTDGVLILERLYKILQAEYKWNFSRFEWGLYFYRKTIGEDTQEPKIKSELEKHPELQTPLSLVKKLPVVGTMVEVATSLDETQAWARNLRKPHEDIREKFDKLTPKEQQAELPGLFAEDLNAHTKDIPAPVVFLLDTYERIAESDKQGSALRRDLWLHGENGLICLTKNTLWVIAGRHKVQWKVEMEQHLLGDLSYEDASAFLTGEGIPQELITGLCKLTGGTPLYLDVCVDQYDQLLRRNEEPEISKFGLGDSDRLIECYLKYMDPRVKEMVYMLSFIPLWDKKLVRSAAEEVLGGFHLAEFNQVKKLSITRSLNQADHTEQTLYTDHATHADQTLYFIHRAVAETLQNDPENESREDTARFLINHFRPMLDTELPYSEAYARALINILHGGLLLHKDRTELADFYRTTMQEQQDVLCRCHCYDVVNQLLASYWERAAEKPSDFLYAAALYEKAWRTYQRYDGAPHLSIIGIIHDILAWTMESLHLLQKIGMEDHILVPQALEAMAVYFAALGYPHEPNLPIAIVLHQYAIHLYKTRHPHDPIALINCRRNLALTYQQAEDYDATVALLRENLELAEERLEPGDRHRLQVLQDLADFHCRYGDLEEALERSKQALDQKTVHLSEKDPDTISSMIALADLYQKMDNIPEEAKLRENVLRICRKYLAQDHQDITSAISALADAYRNMQDYFNEVPLREELVERLPAECTDEYPQNFDAILDLARVYHHLQWWDKRDDLCVSWCRVWADENLSVRLFASVLLDFACRDFRDYSLGMQLWQILAEAPLSPYEETQQKISLADIHFHCGELQEALDILEEIRKTEPRHSLYWRKALEGQIEIRRAMGQADLAQKIENVVWEEIELEAYNILDQEAKRLTRYEGAQAISKIKGYSTPTDLTGLSLQEVLVRVFLEMPAQCFEKLSAPVAKELDEQARLYTQRLSIPDTLEWKFISPDYSELGEETIKIVQQFVQESAMETEEPE